MKNLGSCIVLVLGLALTGCLQHSRPCGLVHLTGVWRLKVVATSSRQASFWIVTMSSDDTGSVRPTVQVLAARTTSFRRLRASADSVFLSMTDSFPSLPASTYSMEGRCLSDGSLSGEYQVAGRGLLQRYGTWAMSRADPQLAAAPTLQHAPGSGLRRLTPQGASGHELVSVAYLLAALAGIGLLIWIASTMRTDPRGYTHVATCGLVADAERARTVLERRGIPVRLDDHSYPMSQRTGGGIRLLVPDDRIGEAVKHLQSHVASERRQKHMHIIS